MAEHITLRGGATTQDPRLDRVPQWDPANLSFRLAEVAPAELRKKTWALPVRLDQGQEGACVGFGWTHAIDCEPNRHGYGNSRARSVYQRAKQLDSFPGEDYEGTGVLAGAKAVRELGWITTFRWATSVDDILRTLSSLGPVVMGTVWRSGMYRPGSDGYLRVTGGVVGGHCWCVRGVDPERERVTMTNSWGKDWGKGGSAYLTFTDLEKLFNDDGEAVAATEH